MTITRDYPTNRRARRGSALPAVMFTAAVLAGVALYAYQDTRASSEVGGMNENYSKAVSAAEYGAELAIAEVSSAMRMDRDTKKLVDFVYGENGENLFNATGGKAADQRRIITDVDDQEVKVRIRAASLAHGNGDPAKATMPATWLKDPGTRSEGSYSEVYEITSTARSWDAANDTIGTGAGAKDRRVRPELFPTAVVQTVVEVAFDNAKTAGRTFGAAHIEYPQLLQAPNLMISGEDHNLKKFYPEVSSTKSRTISGLSVSNFQAIPAELTRSEGGYWSGGNILVSKIDKANLLPTPLYPKTNVKSPLTGDNILMSTMAGRFFTGETPTKAPTEAEMVAGSDVANQIANLKSKYPGVTVSYIGDDSKEHLMTYAEMRAKFRIDYPYHTFSRNPDRYLLGGKVTSSVTLENDSDLNSDHYIDPNSKITSLLNGKTNVNMGDFADITDFYLVYTAGGVKDTLRSQKVLLRDKGDSTTALPQEVTIFNDTFINAIGAGTNGSISTVFFIGTQDHGYNFTKMAKDTERGNVNNELLTMFGSLWYNDRNASGRNPFLTGYDDNGAPVYGNIPMSRQYVIRPHPNKSGKYQILSLEVEPQPDDVLAAYYDVTTTDSKGKKTTTSYYTYWLDSSGNPLKKGDTTSTAVRWDTSKGIWWFKWTGRYYWADFNSEGKGAATLVADPNRTVKTTPAIGITTTGYSVNGTWPTIVNFIKYKMVYPRDFMLDELVGYKTGHDFRTVRGAYYMSKTIVNAEGRSFDPYVDPETGVVDHRKNSQGEVMSVTPVTVTDRNKLIDGVRAKFGQPNPLPEKGIWVIDFQKDSSGNYVFGPDGKRIPLASTSEAPNPRLLGGDPVVDGDGNVVQKGGMYDFMMTRKATIKDENGNDMEIDVPFASLLLGFEDSFQGDHDYTDIVLTAEVIPPIVIKASEAKVQVTELRDFRQWWEQHESEGLTGGKAGLALSTNAAYRDGKPVLSLDENFELLWNEFNSLAKWKSLSSELRTRVLERAGLSEGEVTEWMLRNTSSPKRRALIDALATEIYTMADAEGNFTEFGYRIEVSLAPVDSSGKITAVNIKAFPDTLEGNNVYYTKNDVIYYLYYMFSSRDVILGDDETLETWMKANWEEANQMLKSAVAAKDKTAVLIGTRWDTDEHQSTVAKGGEADSEGKYPPNAYRVTYENVSTREYAAYLLNPKGTAWRHSGLPVAKVLYGDDGQPSGEYEYEILSRGFLGGEAIYEDARMSSDGETPEGLELKVTGGNAEHYGFNTDFVGVENLVENPSAVARQRDGEPIVVKHLTSIADAYVQYYPVGTADRRDIDTKWGLKDWRFAVGFHRAGMGADLEEAGKLNDLRLLDHDEWVMLSPSGYMPYVTIEIGGKKYLRKNQKLTTDADGNKVPVPGVFEDVKLKRHSKAIYGEDAGMEDYTFNELIDGSGVLVVNGNLVVRDTFAFNGILVVSGDIEVVGNTKTHRIYYAGDGNPIGQVSGKPLTYRFTLDDLLTQGLSPADLAEAKDRHLAYLNEIGTGRVQSDHLYYYGYDAPDSVDSEGNVLTYKLAIDTPRTVSDQFGDPDSLAVQGGVVTPNHQGAGKRVDKDMHVLTEVLDGQGNGTGSYYYEDEQNNRVPSVPDNSIDLTVKEFYRDEFFRGHLIVQGMLVAGGEVRSSTAPGESASIAGTAGRIDILNGSTTTDHLLDQLSDGSVKVTRVSWNHDDGIPVRTILNDDLDPVVTD